MRLYSGEQTLPVSVKGLTRADTGEYIDDAVIELYVYRSAGTDNLAPGYSWPLTLTSVGNGSYTGAVQTNFEEGYSYGIKVNITSGDNVQTYERRVMAGRRPF